MNVRKPADYSALFAALDKLMSAKLPQMQLYREIGRIVSSRPEKGAAVAAAEYLCSVYPDASGFSPRNLRRMREFYRTYKNAPEVMAGAMSIGWTQNVVILEADLTLQEREWYIQAARQFCWSKLTLLKAIKESSHETIVLDNNGKTCYSQDTGSDENGSEEASGTLLQGLRDAEIQRELQREGSRGSHMQSLLPSLTGTAGGADDAPAAGESAAAPSERERDDVAEKPHTRSPSRGAGACLAGFFGKIPSLGTKSEKTGIVHNKAGAVYRRRGLRFRWQSCSDKKSYLICRKPPSISRTQQGGESQTVEPQSKALAKLLKWTVHTLEIFCWKQDFCCPADVELDDEAPLWRVHVEYGNGEIQDTSSSNDIPDKLYELLYSLSEFFEKTIYPPPCYNYKKRLTENGAEIDGDKR